MQQEAINTEYLRTVGPVAELDIRLGDDALDRSIQARYNAYSQVMRDAEPLLVPPRAMPEVDPIPNDELERWRIEMIEDRRINFLYDEYVKLLTRIHPRALELEEFSEVVCARAVLRLLVYVPRGPELLASLFDDDRYPPEYFRKMRQAAVTAILNNILEETDDELFLARLFWEVPGSRAAVYRLLGAYKEVVRLQAEEDETEVSGELPDDELRQPVYWDHLARVLGVDRKMPHEESITIDLALERAILAVVRNQMSLRQAEREYGVSRSRLNRELRKRGYRNNQRKEKDAGGGGNDLRTTVAD